jgi:hypothetical protein
LAVSEHNASGHDQTNAHMMPTSQTIFRVDRLNRLSQFEIKITWHSETLSLLKGSLGRCSLSLPQINPADSSGISVTSALESLLDSPPPPEGDGPRPTF